MLAFYLPKRTRTSIWGSQRNDELHCKRSISWALSIASCPYPFLLLHFPCSPGCPQQWIQYCLEYVVLIPWRHQHLQNPFPFSPFCFLFQQFSVFAPIRNSPLVPAYYTGQHALPAPWLPAAIKHALQLVAEAWHPIQEETASEPPLLSCSGSCTSMYRIVKYIPRHN